MSNGTKIFTVTVYDVYGAASAVTQATDTSDNPVVVNVQATVITAAVADAVVGSASASIALGDIGGAAVQVTSLMTDLQGSSDSTAAASAQAQAVTLVGAMTSTTATGGIMSPELVQQVFQTSEAVASVGTMTPESQTVVLEALINATSQASIAAATTT